MGETSVPPAPNVFVTGSSGHLGTALMLKLPSLGYTPIGVDILPAETTHFVGSIADRGFISGVLSSNPSLQHILHSATLHKPHVESHSVQSFIDVNLTGTQVLLEAAQTLKNLESFIFVSTTSTYGAALVSAPHLPAVWIDESSTPRPKNIYGVTKCAAEDLCYLAHKNAGLPVLVLRVSRFFPEEDDDEERRSTMSDDNLKVLELAYRRCDIADIVSACHCAMLRARQIGWDRFIISAPPPFDNDPAVRQLLSENPRAALQQAVPELEAVFQQRGWQHLSRLDRVYDSQKALRDLGWQPYYTISRVVELLAQEKEWRSPLTAQVGKKGYHATTTGVYTKR